MNNRRIELHKRPAPAVGNNKHKKFIQWITEYLSMAGGQANTLDIYYWLNDNTKHGLQINALVNVLSKGPFEAVGEESTHSGLGVKRVVKIWQVKVDKVEERSEKA
tara:strand:- start:5883 stop:6200 length:318 start_codon:yes stop_codon:yes gene_type:complete